MAFSLFRNLFLRRRVEQDLDEELKAYLDLLIDEEKQRGFSDEEARCAALRRLGRPEQIKESIRDLRPGEEFQRCWQDLRYAWRTLWKRPLFPITAICILTLGIGANTAMFSIMDAVLLRPLPYRAPEQLVRIVQSEPKMGELRLGTAPPEFVAYRDRTRVFSSVAGYQSADYDVTEVGEPQHVPASRITASLFQTLDVKPFLGRAFTVSDESPDAERVVLLSYAFWVHQYGSDPHALDKAIRLDDRPYQIIGVMPPGFGFPSGGTNPAAPPALWVPLAFTSDDLKDWASSFDTSVIARLRPGMHLAQAQEDVKRVAHQFERENPDTYAGNTILEASAEPWKEDLNTRIPQSLLWLSAAVALVLLIACSNVGNLVIARMAERQREISIRRALGASRLRLARQVLSETAILAGIAGSLGCGLAVLILRAVEKLWSTDLNFSHIGVNGPVLGFTLLLTGIVCLICGLAPAVSAQNPELYDALRQAGQQTTTTPRRRLSRLLLGAEVACSMVLLVTGWLFFDSFRKLLDVPLGFDPENVLVVRTNFNGQRYASSARRRTEEREMMKRLAGLHQVSAVALTTHVPLADGRKIGFLVEGAPPDDFHWADNAIVDGGYFAVMHTRLVRGRTFSETDTPASPKVAIINQNMARQYWRQQDPIGGIFRWGGRPFRVVGIVEDIHIAGIDRSVDPTIYFDAFQMENHVLSSGVFVIRTAHALNTAELIPHVRKAIWSVDPAVPILGFSTMNEVVSTSLSTRRASMILAAGFASLACALALAGIYSVFSQALSSRVREIGLRLALGAQPGTVRREFLAEGLRLVLLSMAAGIVLALLLTRLLSSVLFGIRSFEPLAYLVSATVILVLACIGLFVPARRASRVDPITALRCD